MSILLIVGIHFLPMGLAFGWETSILGGLCITNAGLGLALPTLSFPILVALDGALKITFGGWMMARRAS